MSNAFISFRSRDFLFYALSKLLVDTAEQMAVVALGWELYLRTHSSLVLGWLGLVRVLPFLFFFLPAGHTADRFNRKAVCLASMALQGLSIAGLAWLSYYQASPSSFYLLTFCMALAWAFYSPARAALLPELVDMGYFSNAVAWNSIGFQMAAVGGPVLAGWILRAPQGAMHVYLSAAGLSAAALVLLAPVRKRQAAAPAKEVSMDILLAGIHFVRQEKIILSSITLDLFAVLFGGATALMPVFAMDILKVGSVGLGWLRAAPFLGAFLMGLLIAYLPPMRQAGKSLLWAVTGFGLCMIVFGISKNFWLSLAALALSGALDNISVVIRHTLVQVRTPNAMRGRVSAINGMFIGISNEMGEFESGLTAWLVGPLLSVVGGGICTILVVLAATKLWPELMKLGNLQSPDS